jgi:peptide/nickel transport system substrate-binding protein
MRPHRLLAIAAAVSIAAIGLSACSSTSAPTPAASTADDLTLHFGLDRTMPTWDIGGLQSGTIDTLYNSVFDTLLHMNADGTIEAGAAKSWKYSADNLTLTLELRSGMKFTDDNPVDAAAVKASLERIKTGGASAATFLANVATVDAPSATTVVLNLSKPDPGLLGYLTQRGGVIESPAAFADPNVALDPVGSGPYSLDAAATTDGSTYTLVRNPDFRNAKDYPYKTVVFSVFTSYTAALNALQSGQINYAALDQSTAAGAKAAGLNVQPMKYFQADLLYLADRAGTIVPALGNVKVRQAINFAIDRDNIAKNLVDGFAEANVQLLAPSANGYVKKLNDLYTYDVTQAKKLMKDAGFADGFDVTIPSTAATLPYEPTLTQELAAINIRVTWTPVPTDQFNARAGKGEWPMFIFPIGMETVQHDFGVNVLPNALFNPFKSDAPELSKAIATTLTATDPKDVTAAYAAAETYITENAWFAPIVDLDRINGTDKSVVFTPPTGNVHIALTSFAPAK